MSASAAYLDAIRKEIMKHPATKKIGLLLEDKTKVNSEYFVLGLAGLIAACLFINIGARFISHLVGFVYPFYATVAAIESKTKNDDTQWLVYWTVFGLFCVVENFVEWILYWIPFYYPLKVSFLLWCFVPKFHGAQIVYNNIIKPQFDKHSSSIDAAISSLSSKEGMDSAISAANSAKESLKKSAAAATRSEDDK